MVRFTLVLLYPPRKILVYPVDKTLGVPNCRSGRCKEEINLALWGTEPGFSIPSLYRLNCPDPLHVYILITTNL